MKRLIAAEELEVFNVLCREILYVVKYGDPITTRVKQNLIHHGAMYGHILDDALPGNHTSTDAIWKLAECLYYASWSKRLYRMKNDEHAFSYNAAPTVRLLDPFELSLDG